MLLLACAASGVVGCGSSSSSSTSSAQASAGKKTLSLKIGVGSSSLNYGPFWVAEGKDLFKKNGLTIDVVSYNTSGTTANVVASGQVDVQLFTAPLGLQLAEQGKPISMIYELSTFSASGMSVIGTKGVTSFDDLRSADNCRIATTAVGTVPYAYAVRYKEVDGLSNCKLVRESSAAPVMAAVTSGSAQAAVITYGNALKSLAAKKVTLILNPLQVPPGLAKKLAPTEYPSFVVFGLRSTLTDHREGVVRFIRTLRQANKMMEDMSPQELAEATAPLQAMQGVPVSALAKGWKATIAQVPTGDRAGYISSDAWDAALKGFEEWGLPQYDSGSPAVAYDQAVDMSYFTKAG